MRFSMIAPILALLLAWSPALADRVDDSKSLLDALKSSACAAGDGQALGLDCPPAPEPEPPVIEPEPEPPVVTPTPEPPVVEPAPAREFVFRDFTGWDTIRAGANNWKLFHPHTAGGGSRAARVIGDSMVYEIIGAPDSYRSEHAIQAHLRPGHSKWVHFLTRGVQYAIALPVSIHTKRKSPLAAGPGTVGDLGRSGIIFQFHEPAGGTLPPVTITQRDGDLVVNWTVAGGSSMLIPKMVMGRRYNVVMAYKLADAGDHVQVFVDGVLKADRRGRLFNRVGHFIKQGLYWTGRKSYQRAIDAQIRFRLSGYGQFAGRDAVAAALDHVGK